MRRLLLFFATYLAIVTPGVVAATYPTAARVGLMLVSSTVAVAAAAWVVGRRLPPKPSLSAYERMVAECEPCWCPCHKPGPNECERGGCCYGPYLCNSERNRPPYEGKIETGPWRG